MPNVRHFLDSESSALAVHATAFRTVFPYALLVIERRAVTQEYVRFQIDALVNGIYLDIGESLRSWGFLVSMDLKEPGVAGSSPFTLTTVTSLAIPISSSSSSNSVTRARVNVDLNKVWW